MAAAIVAVARTAELRIVRSLRASGATSPATAVSISPGSWIHRRRRANLERKGVILQAPSGGYYLDESAWEAYEEARQQRIWIVLALVVVLLLVLMFMVWKNGHA